MKLIVRCVFGYRGMGNQLCDSTSCNNNCTVAHVPDCYKLLEHDSENVFEISAVEDYAGLRLCKRCEKRIGQQTALTIARLTTSINHHTDAVKADTTARDADSSALIELTERLTERLEA